MNTRQDHAVWNPLDEATKPRGGLLLAILAICILSLVYSCAGAATITWGCIRSTHDVFDKPLMLPVTYTVLLRAVDGSQLFTRDIQCTNPVSVPVPDPAGKYYDLTTTATNSAGASYPSGGLRIASLPTSVEPPTKIDCVVSAYGEWTVTPWTPAACDGTGIQTQQQTHSRTITTQPANGGAACPALSESRTVTQPCVIPAPNALQVSEPTAYRLDLGNANQVKLSRIGTIPLGTKCIDQLVLGMNVVAYRQLAVIDSGKSRPLAVLAKCASQP